MRNTAAYADTIYLNGSIWPGAGATAAPEPTALATAGGRVLRHGTDTQVRELAGPGTTVIDLQGRRVIPGLIDGHMHAVRAGATWSEELHWTGVPDVTTALRTIEAATRRAAAGEWIRAVGGWYPCQFTENREPTRAELDQVAPDHPVYLQALYEVAILNSAAIRASGLDKISADPPGGHVERDPLTGEPTGRVHGMGAYTFCLQAAGTPGPAERVQSTAAMFADLAASGLTGIVDPGGFGMTPESYDTLFELWRREQLPLRMRLFLSATNPGQEYTDLDGWLRHAQHRFGNEMLRYAGIGEVVHFGCHDFEGLEEFSMSAQAQEELRQISYRTAERGWPMNIHAVTDESITAILDCWESVNETIPLAGLRFSLSHADQISERNISRLRALDAGVVLDDHQVFKGTVSAASWGSDTMRRVPPLAALVAGGIPLAAGTDASRASSYSPWLSLWWLITGASLDGTRHRAAEHLASREQALAWYTSGSAWLTFEEGERGHLRSGARADFAVLSEDYFTVPEERIRGIRSELTVVGGKSVHSTGTIALPSDRPGRNDGPAMASLAPGQQGCGHDTAACVSERARGLRPMDRREEVTFRSDVTVELVKHAASDADVLWAARVSTKGEQSLAEVEADPERSAGLINFMMRDRHGTPFEHSSMTFYVQAPIFVFREFMRHRTFSYNEESGRYRRLEPVFYVPGPGRKLVQQGKPGAYEFTDGTPAMHKLVDDTVRESCRAAYAAYLEMLDAGVAREVARTVLPVAIYSSMYATCNARALMNFLSLRRRSGASTFPSFPQREIEMVAELMEAEWARLMPLTHAAFERNGRVCP